MKELVCLVFCLACVVAENCRYDSDCKTTTCSTGFRIDCLHVYEHDSHYTHFTNDAGECTCRPNSDHVPCFGSDQWCLNNMSGHDCHKDGKTWHCSTRDNQCHCYCDRRTQHCHD